jgi:hypothetical protein
LTDDPTQSQEAAEDSTIITTFSEHILPLFTKRDREKMLWAFDLHSVDEVRAHAYDILEKVAEGEMPCDRSWPLYDVEVLRRWLKSGMRE